MSVRQLVERLLLAALTALLTACSAVEPEMVMVPLSPVGHYGKKIGVPDFWVNGRSGGNSPGWGGGGLGMGSVPLPRYPKEPYYVTVKWESCDIGHIVFVNGRNNNPEDRCISETHEQRVPVHFVVPPGSSYALVIHFLPGHQVQAWVTQLYPEAKDYSGPAFPRGPAPDYAPLPDGTIPTPAAYKNKETQK